MSTQAYKDWVERGRPWTKARPVADVEKWARANGVKVLGTIGDVHHLTSNRPQDHTPFSVTEWPDPIKGDVVCAIDLEDEPGLADDILSAARAGRLPWLKYANLNGRNYHCRDGFEDADDSDDEHVHLSVRSDHINTHVPADWLKRDAKPSKPADDDGAGRPAPGPDLAFPLPKGHWFGRDDGTDRSHSGLHGRKTGGKLDSTHIKAWASQLSKRGWSVGKGKTYLTRHGNDGKWGDEYDELCEAFQREMRLDVDRKNGPRTWNTAFDHPIT